MSNENKKIEVVNGNGNNLNISPVYEHLNAAKPNTNKPKDIIIPKEKKSKSSKN